MKTLAKPTNLFTRLLYTPVQTGLALFLVLAAIAAGLVVLRFVPQLREGEQFRWVSASTRTGRQGAGRPVPLPPPPQSSMAATDHLGYARPPLGEYYVGVYVDSLDPALAAQLKLQKGIVVRHIVPGSPAEAAGLKPNDLLMTAGEAPLDQVCSLGAAINQAKETEIAIEVLREGQSLKVAMTPTKRPAQMWIPPNLETASVDEPAASPTATGKWVYIDPAATPGALGPGGLSATLPSTKLPSTKVPSAPKTEQSPADQASAAELKKAIEKLEKELTQAHEEVKALKAKLAEQKKEN